MFTFFLLALLLTTAEALATDEPLVSETASSCEASKLCAASPVSKSDATGLQKCSTSTESVTCLTVPAAPFWSCLCKCGVCGRNCDTACPSRKIIVIGGSAYQQEYLASVEIYDFRTKTWSSAEDLPQARTYVGAAALGDRVYATGGYTHLEIYANVDVFSKQKWSTAPPDLQRMRYSHGVAVVGGKMYVVGGWSCCSGSLETVEMFDPAKNAWTTLAANMTDGRHGLATGVIDGNIYAVGGLTTRGGWTTSVEMFNPKKQTWTMVAPLGTSRVNLCAAVVGKKLYAIGGQDMFGRPRNIVEVYDSTTNSWSPAANMTTARNGAGTVALDGLIYVVGGMSETGYVDTVDVYDPVADKWDVLPGRMLLPRRNAGVALM